MVRNNIALDNVLLLARKHKRLSRVSASELVCHECVGFFLFCVCTCSCVTESAKSPTTAGTQSSEAVKLYVKSPNGTLDEYVVCTVHACLHFRAIFSPSHAYRHAKVMRESHRRLVSCPLDAAHCRSTSDPNSALKSRPMLLGQTPIMKILSPVNAVYCVVCKHQ